MEEQEKLVQVMEQEQAVAVVELMQQDQLLQDLMVEQVEQENQILLQIHQFHMPVVAVGEPNQEQEELADPVVVELAVQIRVIQIQEQQVLLILGGVVEVEHLVGQVVVHQVHNQVEQVVQEWLF